MPEGPEIRLAADKIAKCLEGKTVENIDVGLSHLEAPSKHLTGKRVLHVETRGKAMLIHFEHGFSIYSHNQLYGVWKIAKPDKLPNTKRSLRLALHTADQSAILYSASDIGVYETPRLAEHPFLAKLGPDILSPQLQREDLAARLISKRFRNRALSSLYLDQHFIAGIGNYLRTEILFAAGLHPDVKPKDLTEDQIHTLAEQTIVVSLRAYETKGHTVAPELQSELAKTKGSYEAVRFMAFNREGEPCRVCVSPIIKGVRNARRIYWCERCNKSV